MIQKDALIRTRFEWFVRQAMPDFVWSGLHRAVCTRLDDWIRQPSSRLILDLPYRSGKSSLAAVLLPLYLATLDDEHSIGVFSPFSPLAQARMRKRTRIAQKQLSVSGRLRVWDCVTTLPVTGVRFSHLVSDENPEPDFPVDNLWHRLDNGGRALIVGTRLTPRPDWDYLYLPPPGFARPHPPPHSGQDSQEQGFQEELDALAVADDEKAMLEIESIYADWRSDHDRSYARRPLADGGQARSSPLPD